ncbi:MAG: hypothetical protein HYX75_03940 [Acidobacteria bacterium]|nr:hypothetical protein [Acidobacteriota bacterium]
MPLEVPRSFYWVMAAICVLILLILTQTSFFKHEKPDAIRAGVEIIELDSFWTEKSASPTEVTMVPAITFRIRNKRAAPLEYLQVNGVFAFVGDAQTLGDSFGYPIEGAPLPTGQTTGVIRLKSNFGYRASSKQAFLDNPGFKPVEVKLFAQSRASGPVLIGTYPVSRRLEGVAEIPQTQPAVLPMKVE